MTRQAKTAMNLDRLLADFVYVGEGEKLPAVTFSGIHADSRRIAPGDLFAACCGVGGDGRDYLGDAVSRGAVAVLLESESAEEAGDLAAQYGLPVVAVPALGRCLGELVSRFYAEPSHVMAMVGVTGTNGKTSCSTFLAQCLDEAGGRCGLVGTLGNGLWGELTPATHTTPAAEDLQAMLAGMRDAGATRVAMEVSSHGLEQGRVAGVHFKVAALTNLSRDHLDYHGDMEAYAAAKRKLFHSPGLEYGVLNLDDSLGLSLARELAGELKLIGYTLQAQAPQVDFPVLTVTALEARPAGLWLRLGGSFGEAEIQSRLIGRFNAANLLLVVAVLRALDFPLVEACARAAGAEAPAGRMELFQAQGRPQVVVDYAHTPDALAQALASLRHHCAGSLLLVFGCGGDRDRGKRAEMGTVAEELADVVFVTDDNPRSEAPEAIVADIVSGMRQPQGARVIHDRREAITAAVAQGGAGDMILVAGKGHEDYQIIGNERRHFSDREVVTELLREAA